MRYLIAALVVVGCAGCGETVEYTASQSGVEIEQLPGNEAEILGTFKWRSIGLMPSGGQAYNFDGEIVDLEVVLFEMADPALATAAGFAAVNGNLVTFVGYALAPEFVRRERGRNKQRKHYRGNKLHDRSSAVG